MCWRGRRTRHDRNAFYLSTGTQSGAGDCTALVVPQFVPRHAGKTSLPGKHQFVIIASDQVADLIDQAVEQDGVGEVGARPPAPEISK
jgi:hypothetical protein